MQTVLLLFISLYIRGRVVLMLLINVCMYTSTYGVAVVRIYDAGLKRAARGSLEIQDAKNRQKSPSAHYRTNSLGYILATKTHIDNRKNLLSSNISSRRLHNMVNFGPLAAEIGPVVWGTPANFNGFRVLVALLHGTPVVGVSQTAALNRGRHLYLAGRPSRLALAHILFELFSLALAAETLQGEICRRERFLKGVGHFDRPF